MQDKLTHDEQQILLRLAREAMILRVKGGKLPRLDLSSLPERLREDGASFITLTIRGELRGCIGALEPHQPLAEDVREHAAAAALEDPRFAPVSEGELSTIQIEVSRLTRPVQLEYADADDLISKLKPHVDGVILHDVFHHATFLPQVWEKIPDPVEFLNQLCWKMGMSENAWRAKHLEVFTYQAEDFHESPNNQAA
ncbi:MAG TPA: AmmeMemoRadiSam system protein A [Anaerolineales bacterium]|nr:AmmeMemoRadiSam system protein A [Anaerolineales bacterium]